MTAEQATIETLRRWSHLLLWVSILLPVLGALAVGARYYVERREKELSARTTTAAIQEAKRDAASAAKYEYRPLDLEMRARVADPLKRVRSRFSNRPLSVLVTYEPGAPPPTRQYAAELADLFRDAGFDVKGPDFATVYLLGPSFPMQAAYNDKDADVVSAVFEALGNVLKVQAVHQTFPEGQARIHIAGRVTFAPNGTASIE